MTKRMLIDATHAEETRVVVLDGNRLEDFDVETSTKKQLKGNIYLAKVVRVEPSLQAAFVEYGGGRHGFLAFGEIHPDYYQIPVADRQRLLDMQAEEAREEEEAEEAAERAQARQPHRPAAPVSRESDRQASYADDDASPSFAGDGATVEDAWQPDEPAGETDGGIGGEPPDEPAHADWPERAEPHPTVTQARADHDADAEASPDPAPPAFGEATAPGEAEHHDVAAVDHGADAPRDHDHDRPNHDDDEPRRPAQAATIAQDMRFGDVALEPASHGMHVPGAGSLEDSLAEADAAAPGPDGAGEVGLDPAGDGFADDAEAPEQDTPPSDLPPPETIGGETDTYDGAAEARARRASRLLRNYRIQEVIRRRQIMLIQVVKEERGTKGAALTTYISLAGRFCVLMPNSPRGGGISRKITSASDRRRLKEITAELEIPRGMGLIVRTAGAARPKPEIKRDCEYLMRLWDDIREHTLKSIAPALIYEEASLIKRAIRDVYSRDVEEILVDGEQGWRAAHDFMRMLMPSHAKKVQLWSATPGSAGQPLFSRQGVEAQLDAMLSPTVQLRSGGYLVLAQTEALVSIDVNSGRSTRERGIEETALKTNLEAADEVARQLRLRDLAGLIVIDFIDMESRKNNAAVERRLKDALKNDRARIQVGHISHFGLLEMSRQRLRPSLAETSFVTCPHCGGAGHVRSVESAAIHVLRAIEDEGSKQRAAQVMVYCAGPVALYLLNHKRDRLGEVEARHAMAVHFTPDDTLVAPAIRIDRLRPQVPDAERRAFAPVIPAAPAFEAETEEEFEEQDDVADEAQDEAGANGQGAGAEPPPRPGETAEEASRRRRRRRRRGGRRDQPGMPSGEPGAALSGGPQDDAAGEAPYAPVPGEDGPEPPMATHAEPAPVDATVPAPVAALVADGQPAIDPTEFDENGLPQPRGPRRSRRGGRRRRRFGEGDGAEPGTEAPELQAPPVYAAPIYTGPTPADPFAGQLFDIFDIMDQPLDIPPVPPNARTPGDVEPLVEPPPAAPSPVHAAEHVPAHVPEADLPAAPGEPTPEPLLPHDPAPDATEPHALQPTHAEASATHAPDPDTAEPEPAHARAEITHAEPVHAEPARVAPAETERAEPPLAGPAATDDARDTAAAPDPQPDDAAHEAPSGASPPAEPHAAVPAEPEPPAAPNPSIVQPIVIGRDAPAPGTKRGWWRA